MNECIALVEPLWCCLCQDKVSYQEVSKGTSKEAPDLHCSLAASLGGKQQASNVMPVAAANNRTVSTYRARSILRFVRKDSI